MKMLSMERKLVLLLRRSGLFLLGLLFCMSVSAQVSGVVTDGQTGDPLIGASIFVKGTSTGTISDIDGSYTIDAPGSGVLVFSFVGYEELEVPVSNRSNVDVTLQVGKLLDEVVVTGYTAQSKRNISGAVSVVSADEIQQIPVSNVAQALQGKASGVTVVSDGRPGGGLSLRIRGISTINNNEPLYVVDGTPVDSWTIQDINPQDIESIQVLKDASAASIYGVRAANGVVIISTKKGSVTGDSKIRLDVYYGSQSPGKGPEFLTPQQLADATWAYQKNAGIAPTHPQYGSGATPALPTYIIPVGANTADESTYNYITNGIAKANKAGTDWYKETFESAPMINLNLSASGGSEQGQYSLSAGVFKQDGVVIHSGYERYSLRANSLYRALDGKLRFGENLSVAYAEATDNTGGRLNENAALSMVYRMPSIIPVLDVGGNYAGTRASGFNNPNNPVAQLTRRKDNVGKSMRLLGSAYVEVDIIEGLTVKSSINANFGLTFENRNYQIKNVEASEPASSATFDQRVDNSRVITWYNTATYTKNLDNTHNFTVLAGTESITDVYTPFGAGRVNYFSDNLAYRHLNTGSDGISNFGFVSESAIFSLFGKIDYDYKGKYILSATIRRDGSSRFAAGNRFGIFPSFSAAWRLSDESFFDDIAFFDDLKIRAGWGKVGNQNIPLNTYLDLFSPDAGTSGYAIGGGNNSATVGINSSQFGNPDVTWETTTQLNVGFDASVLDNKLTVSFDWYDRKTEDMLLGVPRPSLSGLAGNPQVNVGTMKNTGVDLALNYSNQVSRDLTYSIGLTFSKYKNEVVALNDPDQFISGGNFREYQASRTTAGQPIGAFFGYDILGIFQTQAEADAHATQPVNAPGRFKYRDANIDGVINADDRVFLGSPHPDFAYGVNGSVNYKGFDFGVFVQGVQGNAVFNGNLLFTDFFSYFTNSQKGAGILNSWGYPGANNAEATIPQLNQNSPSIELESSSHYVEDGSYLRLKTLTLGYTLPSSSLSKVGFDNVRFYLQGNNILTISDYSGLDPEIGVRNVYGGGADLDIGVDRGNYPVVKSITVGLNVSF